MTNRSRTHNTRSRSKTNDGSKVNETGQQRLLSGGLVALSSSPEMAPDDVEVADDNMAMGIDMDMGMDLDIDIDSDLEALIEECSQPEIQPEKQQLSSSQRSGSLSQLSKQAERAQKHVTGSSSNSCTVKRRAITDRPQFKLVGSRSQTQTQMPLSQTVPTKRRLAFPIERDGAEFGNKDDGDGDGDGGTDDRGQVWWQRYEPKEISELAVHSAKIAQVRGWLEMAAEAAINGGKNGSRFFRILVLEGPAGTCKSTCVRVLARELSLDIVEWVNPLSGQASAAGQLESEDASDASVVRQFADFLMRAERYSALALTQSSSGVSRLHGAHDQGSRGRIILVDDMPNIGHRETRESFRSALLRFVSLPVQRSCPMVIVVTEAYAEQQALDVDPAASGCGPTRRFRESDMAANSSITVWSAADVIPSAVYNSSFCQTIKFNPVAPTIVAKGLKRILQLRAGYGAFGSQIKFTPASAGAVKAISEQCGGDMRSAVTMLQLTQTVSCGQPQQSASIDSGALDRVGGRKRGRSRARVVDVASGTSVGSHSGETRRVALDLFHALGKVLYAKREMPKRPTGSRGQVRGRLESDPFEILDRVPSDLGTFQLFLHENSVDFYSNIEEAAAASDFFSEADLLMGSGRRSGGGGRAGQGVAEAYSAMLAVGGYMHVRGHPQYASGGSDGPVSRPSERAFGMSAMRKPYYFEGYRQMMAHNRLWSDAVSAQSLCSGVSLAGLSAHEVLALWVRIAAGRGYLGGLSADLVQRLARLAMVDITSTSTSTSTGIGSSIRSSSSGIISGGGGSAVGRLEESTEKLVLSDDDIGDFSD